MFIDNVLQIWKVKTDLFNKIIKILKTFVENKMQIVSAIRVGENICALFVSLTTRLKKNIVKNTLVQLRNLVIGSKVN